MDRVLIKDPKLIETIKPAEDCSFVIDRRHDFIKERRVRVEKRNELSASS